jgi:shikimate kinase
MHCTLIGMSGAGKSHVGKQLAAALGYEFFDVDTAMETMYKKPLQQILDELGDERFLLEQATLIQQTDFSVPHVIATGGSIIYTEDAVQYLQTISKIVFIKPPENPQLPLGDGRGNPDTPS